MVQFLSCCGFETPVPICGVSYCASYTFLRISAHLSEVFEAYANSTVESAEAFSIGN